MYTVNLKTLLIGATIFVSLIYAPYTLAYQKETISPSIKIQETIEKRLSIFFLKIDMYPIEERMSTYMKIQERIGSIIGNHKTDSQNYIMLKIAEKIIDKKIDSEEDISTSEVTSPTNGEVEESSDEIIYREDLDTRELNEYDKNIVAGTAKGVISVEVRASLEPIETETVEFRFNQNIDNIGLKGNLYQNGVLIANTRKSQSDGNSLIFSNITDLVIDTKTGYLQLELLPAKIGKDEVGQSIANLIVLSTILKDNTGSITGNTLGNKINGEDSRVINIVPIDIQVSLIQEFEKNISTSILKLSPHSGDNNNAGDDFSADFTHLKIEVSSFREAGEISVFNSNGSEIGSVNISSSGNFSIPLSPDFISNSGEEYRIVSSAKALFRLQQNAIKYTSGGSSFETKMKKQVILGQR